MRDTTTGVQKMYKVQEWDGKKWIEVANSDDFGYCWKYAKICCGGRSRVVGPEGTWEINK